MTNVLLGERFGTKVVVALEYSKKRGTLARVRCDCGRENLAHQSELRKGLGHTCKSCNGRNLSATRPRLRHGMAKTGEYAVWCAMNSRCSNPKARAYKNYGARGIAVCAEWVGPEGFDRFLAHVGRRPSARMTIERIDNALGYEPGNVRWATQSEQNRNKRNNVWLEIRGERRTVTDWAVSVGLDKRIVFSRLAAGCTPEDSLRPTSPRRHGRRR